MRAAADRIEILDEKQIRRAGEYDQRGRLHLNQGEFDLARPLFEKSIKLFPLASSPYNNLAACLYAQGEFEQALQTTRRLLDGHDPNNVFALGGAVHYLILLGRDEEAAQTADRLERLTPHEETGWYKRCEALARLRRHEAVYGAARRGLHGADECRGSICYFAGAAAANLGRYDESAGYLRDALGDSMFGHRAKRFLGWIEKRRKPPTIDGDWPYFGPEGWMVLSTIRELADDGARLKDCPGLVRVALCCIEEDDENSAENGVRLLGMIRTPQAEEALRNIAFGTFGSDRLRMGAMTQLLERGAIPAGESVRIFREGRWTELRPMLQVVTTEARLEPPEEVRDLYLRAREAVSDGRNEEAVRLGREVVKRAPTFAPGLNNLAASLMATDQVVEAESLLLRAVELDPTYLFARVSLARLRIRQDRLDDAEKLLGAGTVQQEVHPTAYVYELTTRAELALARGKVEQALTSLEAAEQIDPDNPHVLESRDAIEPLKHLTEFRKSLENRRRRQRDRHRARLLNARPGLREALGETPSDDLLDILRNIGTGRRAPGRRGERLDLICELLSDPRRIAEIVDQLDAGDHAPLTALVEAGGTMERAEFLRRFGPSSEEEPDRFDRLQARGLLEEGVVAGVESVFIPAEPLAALARY